MESVYHIVTIRVNETSWSHVWRLRFRYLRTGYDNNALTYTKGVFAMFCRKPKASEVSKRRLWLTGEMEARKTAWVEAKSWRGHASSQPEVAAPT
jgi:hypothetical protein